MSDFLQENTEYNIHDWANGLCVGEEIELQFKRISVEMGWK